MDGPPLLTVGHGTLSEPALRAVLDAAGVRRVVDVRTAPGSRRHPHVSRARLSEWLPAAGITYRWEPELGGFRKADPASPHTALRHPAFRGYADHMGTPAFWTALDRLLEEAAGATTAAMCSESVWWRCHRRLLADAAVLAREARVLHLSHDGRLTPHGVTEGARLTDVGLVRYDVGAQPPLLPSP
jgi:uncharacterized protein (DUF488 family)